MKYIFGYVSLCLIASCVVFGCAGQDASSEQASTDPAAAAQQSKYLLKSEPSSARSVNQVRSDSKDNEDVVVVGRIGGDSNPWVEDAAAFVIVDSSFTPCNEIEGDTCPTPWDYCCTSVKELNAGKAMIEFVDEDGQTLPVDARKLLGVKELETVVVQGTARREGDNLTVLATGLYVRK